MRTLRARLTLWYLAIVAAALSLFAVLLYVWLSRTLYGHHDQELRDDAARLAQSIGTAADPIALLTSLDQAQRMGPLVMVRDSSGTTIFRSQRLTPADRGIGEHTALQHAAMQGATTAQFFTVRIEQSAPVRFICLPLDRPAGTYLQLGRRLGDVDVLLRVVLVASLALIPVVVFLMSYGGLFVAGRALAPIDQIARTLESIQATDLSRRVNDYVADAETARLSASVNRLLDRLQRAFDSLSEFSADVSHQMQTPLTVMKIGVDVTLASPRATEEYQRVLRELADEIDALSETVKDLREFSLTEADSSGGGRERVDLSATFDEAADLLCVLAEERGIPCSHHGTPGAQVWGNRIRLRQLILNLGENAIKFSHEGGRVQLTLTRTLGEAVLTIVDEGVGIDSGAVPELFRRRVRDAAAAGSAEGSGLGLALAKRTVDAHGGWIEIARRPERGTSVSVGLPLA